MIQMKTRNIPNHGFQFCFYRIFEKRVSRIDLFRRNNNNDHAKKMICQNSIENGGFLISEKQKGKLNSNFVKKKLIHGYSKIHELKLVTIGIASPQKIQSWAEKELPNGKIFGEVTNANTFHYRTFKASKGGLFCERIFGPIKDFECACGKRQKPTALESKKILEHKQSRRFFCPNCDVEYTWSIIRRYQLGYIKLNAPVAHLWYFKANPSYLSILFDMKRKNLESIIYCNETITIENMWKYTDQNSNLTNSPTELYSAWQKFFRMEENLKEYMLFFEKQEEIKKQKRQTFRNTCFQTKSFQTQIDWKNLDLKNTSNSSFVKSYFLENSISNTVSKMDLIFKILKQKERKRIFFFFEENWKRFFKKHLMNAIFAINSKDYLSENFVENLENLSSIFYFYSINKQKMVQNENFSTFFALQRDLEQTREFSHIQSEEKGNEVSFRIKGRSLSSKQIEKSWKSLFFLFEFANFFLSESQQIKQHLSKKDFLFLINLIPFFKKLILFQNFKFEKKKSRTLQSLLGTFSTRKKNRKFLQTLNSKLLSLSIKANQGNIFFKTTKEFGLFDWGSQIPPGLAKRKQSQNNTIKNCFESIVLDHRREEPTTKKRSYETEIFSISDDFQKILSLFKTYYEIDFFSIFQKNLAELEKLGIEDFQKEQFENNFFQKIFLRDSKISNFFEKVGFEYFVFLFCLFESGKANKFSRLQFLFPDFSENISNSEVFAFQNSHIQKFLFFSLSANPSFFFPFEKSKKNDRQNEMKFLQEKLVSQNEEEVRKIEIQNKPLFLRKKINERKKQFVFDQLKRFYSFDFEVEKNLEKISYGKLSKMFVEKNLVFQNPNTEENEHYAEKMSFLKNRISTIAFHHPWPNDIDWKYFVYYNSLFFQEFEDIPIFRYRFLSYGKTGLDTKNFLFSDSQTSKKDDPFGPLWSMNFPQKNFCVGAGILEKLLIEYTSSELRKMTKQHQILLPKINQTLRVLKQNAKTKKDSLKIQKYFQKREYIIRRLKFLRKFSQRNSNPMFMILRNLPVLPPDLRPILKLQNQIAASDLNRFYQRIIYRNDRLKKFSKDSATNQSFEMKYAQRLLQEAVDNLIQNGKGSGKAETNSRGQPLKSLSEILKGKQGRFRQYLLGKRVDYSGRSVIVVGPKLKLYECGLPKEMALELFLPFLIQYILHSKLAQTVIGAKNLLKSNASFTFHLLRKVMKNIPILLNRAPTLHRLGFQAFLPKLIEGRAILLHPMVCPAFNADFDGDQMAVHIPLTVEARTEAWKLMLSMNNLINSATGEAIVLPSQDMVLGCYYLTLDYKSKFVGVQIANVLKKNFSVQNSNFQNTSKNFKNFVRENKSFLFFQNFYYVFNAYQRKEISLHTPVWVKWNAPIDFGNDFSKPLEIRLKKDGSWQRIQPKYTVFYTAKNRLTSKYIRTTVGRILMNFMIQECLCEK